MSLVFYMNYEKSLLSSKFSFDNYSGS